uniref:Uncharacterized protein n=1 Tax=Arundo donax TaxID=35708 RepID=A0A0A8ZX93_ARUDO
MLTQKSFFFQSQESVVEIKEQAKKICKGKTEGR